MIESLPVSLPVRECGLKSLRHRAAQHNHIVTPRAGVWIEIRNRAVSTNVEVVTPRAGVWIEILPCVMDLLRLMGHSPCGSVD